MSERLRSHQTGNPGPARLEEIEDMLAAGIPRMVTEEDEPYLSSGQLDVLNIMLIPETIFIPQKRICEITGLNSSAFFSFNHKLKCVEALRRNELLMFEAQRHRILQRLALQAVAGDRHAQDRYLEICRIWSPKLVIEHHVSLSMDEKKRRFNEGMRLIMDSQQYLPPREQRKTFIEDHRQDSGGLTLGGKVPAHPDKSAYEDALEADYEEIERDAPTR